MGYDAKLTFGCNVRALFGEIALRNIHIRVLFLFTFIESWSGIKTGKFFY